MVHPPYGSSVTDYDIARVSVITENNVNYFRGSFYPFIMIDDGDIPSNGSRSFSISVSYAVNAGMNVVGSKGETMTVSSDSIEIKWNNMQEGNAQVFGFAEFVKLPA